MAANSKNPLINAQAALNTISGLPPIDVDNLIGSLLKKTENSIANQLDWKAIYQALSSDNNNQDINDTVQQISSLDFISSSSNITRLNKYQDFIMVLKKVPVIKKILRLYTSNILSPDDITKISVKTLPRSPTISKTDEEYISIDAKYRQIMDRINLEEHLYDLVFKTLFYGDMFVEIVSSKRYLLQTIYNLQIPIKDSHIKLNEELNNRYDDITTINFVYDDNKKTTSPKYTVNIEWAKPINHQINETASFANIYYHSIINSMKITEENFHKYSKNGMLRYITESILGDINVISSYDNFRAFNEDFAQYDNNGESDSNLSKKYSLDYLPVQSTLSSLNIKIHTPDKVIILKDDEVNYGYLYISDGIEAVSNSNNRGNSIIASGGASSGSFISTSNFLNATNATSAMNNSNNKGDHARQISNRIYQYIKDKFEEYQGDVNIENMTPNLQMLIADILNRGSNSITIRYIPPLNMQHFKIEGTGLNKPYGEGIVEDLLFRAKLLLADDINGMITRLTATGKRLLWTVTANTHQQAANRIQQLSKAVNKKTISTDNCIDIMSSSIFQNDNIFTARINGEKQVDVETLDLGSYTETTDPNMYHNKQLITGSDIPPAHLGYEEWTSGKNTLSNENVVFAQSIIGYQKQFSNNITSLIQKIYLAIFSHTNEFNLNFKNLIVALNAPRSITLSTNSENMTNLSNIISSMKDLNIPEKLIVNMYWPELYDQLIEAEMILEKLGNGGKGKNSKKLESDDANDNNTADNFGSFGSGDNAFNMADGGISTDNLETLAGGGNINKEAAPIN